MGLSLQNVGIKSSVNPLVSNTTITGENYRQTTIQNCPEKMQQIQTNYSTQTTKFQ